jgi:hypothetical protein
VIGNSLNLYDMKFNPFHAIAHYTFLSSHVHRFSLVCMINSSTKKVKIDFTTNDKYFTTNDIPRDDPVPGCKLPLSSSTFVRNKILVCSTSHIQSFFDKYFFFFLDKYHIFKAISMYSVLCYISTAVVGYK